MQFTVVWGMHDLFGAEGLTFSGFADFWGEEHALIFDEAGNMMADARNASFVFISEPQLWYNVGRHFGCSNLDMGGEVELSWNFGSSAGFRVRPYLGIKWTF